MSGFERVRKLSSWRRISLSAWERPADPSVYGWLDLDVSRALPYLEQRSGVSANKLTLTHLVGKALALAIAECPGVNAVIRRGRHVYQRSSVDIFFQVAYDAGGNLSGAKVDRADQKSLEQIGVELGAAARAIRSHGQHELSRSDATLGHVPPVLRKLVLRAVEAATYDWGLDLSRFGVPADGFGSAMVTNVGMFGLPHGLAPLVPFSRAPIVLTIGEVRDAAIVDSGQVVVRPVLSVGVTLDHRLLDGFQAGRLAKRFCAVICDPAAHL
jgi:pyruvate dehydrogenase E2 component (dihydrolipoamide acetyltransferase)